MGNHSLSRSDLEAMMADGLSRADDEVSAAWESMRCVPARWQCSPWGDEDGGFWIVGRHGDSVVWYNHIEEGFNVSKVTTEGIVGEYWCNQGDFHDFLMTLPEAREAENWPAMNADATVPASLANGGEILRRQTDTYWEVRAPDNTTWRCHFKGKHEFAYDQPTFASSEVYDRHPLLWQHQEAWAQLYFSSAPSDPEAVERAVDERILQESDGWRGFDDYVPVVGVSLAATANSWMARSAWLSTSRWCSRTREPRAGRPAGPHRLRSNLPNSQR